MVSAGEARHSPYRRRRRSSAPLSPASGWCPHLIATLCIVVGAGHQRHSPPQAGGAPTSSLRSASSSAQVISATLPRKRVVPPPHRYALHRTPLDAALDPLLGMAADSPLAPITSMLDPAIITGGGGGDSTGGTTGTPLDAALDPLLGMAADSPLAPITSMLDPAIITGWCLRPTVYPCRSMQFVPTDRRSCLGPP